MLPPLAVPTSSAHSHAVVTGQSGPHDPAGLVLAIPACFVSNCLSLKPEKKGKPCSSMAISGEQPLPVLHGGRSQQLRSDGGPVVIIHPSLLLEVGGAKEKTIRARERATPATYQLWGLSQVSLPRSSAAPLPPGSCGHQDPAASVWGAGLVLSFLRPLRAGSVLETGSSSQAASRPHCLCERRLRLAGEHGSHPGWLLPTLLQHAAWLWRAC